MSNEIQEQGKNQAMRKRKYDAAVVACPNGSEREGVSATAAASVVAVAVDENNCPSITKTAAVTATTAITSQQQLQPVKPWNHRSAATEPITQEGERPQKKFYRQRAHCNPLSHNDSFSYPIRPQEMDWTEHYYPHYKEMILQNDNNSPVMIQPTILDVGCGFGGLTMALGKLFPSSTTTTTTTMRMMTTTNDPPSQEQAVNTIATTNTLPPFVLGLEIRAKVTEYVRLRVAAARSQENTHHNVSVLRTNAQKFLPHYLRPYSMQKLFFCFPDPHFKRKNHPRRIVSERLLTEYAHLLIPGIGKLYTITDVKELHEWHVQKCDSHPLFERVVVHNGGRGDDPDHQATAEKDDDDPCVQVMITETEEGQKVQRNRGSKYYCVYRRIGLDEESKHPALQWTADNFFA